MTNVVPLNPPARDECRCARCHRAARRFPADPPQLVLPLGWPAELVVTAIKGSA